ncbi:MAG TPA: DinB family protein [Fimbriimonas sp.]|nr:DinB family protein [Fimbriimonas sp.]
MRIQDYMADASRKAAAEMFRYAKSVPSDKLDWSPLDNGRSVISQARELAMTPTWAYDTIAGGSEMNEEAFAAQKAEMDGWTTVEQCEEQFNTRFAKVEELFKGLSDERLSETKWLPYDGGRDFTVLEMMDYPRWNANYHLGQIAYIQTLYGDKEMH